MDLKYIDTFLTVANLKNITHAAKKLNYAQSTVTAQIQQLEAELGFALFDRIGKRIYLTSYGREFLIYALQLSHTMQQAQTIALNPENMHGVLKLGIIESLFFSVIIDILPVFKKKYPNMELQVQLGGSDKLSSLLYEDKIDVLYTAGPLNMNPHFITSYKRKEELIFVASSGHELLSKENVTLADIFSHELIVSESTGVCYKSLEKLAAYGNYTLKYSIMLDNLNAISALMRKYSGLSFLPEYAASADIYRGYFQKIQVSDMNWLPYYTQILCHRDRWISPYVADFIKIICKYYPER